MLEPLSRALCEAFRVGRPLSQPSAACARQTPRRHLAVRIFALPPAAFVVAALMSFVALNSAVWSFVQPPEAGPDENAYLAVVEFIAEHERFPVFDEDPGMGMEARNLLPGYPAYAYRSYADRPGLAFVVSAAALRLPGDGARSVYIKARLPGALYAAAFVLFAALTARSMMPNRPEMMVVVAAIAAAWPQVSIATAAVNDDGLMLAACGAVMWCWHRGATTAWPLRWGLALGAALGICLLAKPSGYVLMAMSIPVAITTLRGSVAHVTGRVLAVLATLLMVSGWRIVDMYRMYGWDPFNSARTAQLMEELGAQTFSARDTGMSFTGMLSGRDVVTAVSGGPWPSTVADTMLATLSTNRVTLPSGIAMLVFALVAVAGMELLLRAATRPWGVRRRWRALSFRAELCIFGLVPIYVAALAWRNYSVDYVPSGQYLFPIFLPCFIAIAWGLGAAGRGEPRRMRILLVAVGALLGLCNYRALDIVREIHSVSFRPWLGDGRLVLLVAWVLMGAIAAWTSAVYLSRVSLARPGAPHANIPPSPAPTPLASS